VTAAKIVFLRSISKVNNRYDSLICDSEAKTMSELNKCEFYGPNFTNEKIM